MLILKIIALSTGSIVVLFILTKIMGQREMSQLSIFDYIISITIGSIAAEMATSLEDNFVEPLVAMIVYAVVTLMEFLTLDLLNYVLYFLEELLFYMIMELYLKKILKSLKLI